MVLKKVKLPAVNLVATPASEIVLSITIGNAQIGGNVVYLNDAPIAKGEIQNLGLGTGLVLSGKVLKIITNVLDVNPATNKISITHFFYSAECALHVHEDSVDADGDVLSLTRTYKFL